MPTLPIRQLGQKGLMRDLPAQDIPVNEFTSIDNVQIQDGAVESLGRIAVANSFTDTPVYAAPFWIPGNDGIVAVEKSDLNVITINFYGNNWVATDITPAGGVTFTDYWYHVQLGDRFALTNGIDDPIWIEAADIGTSPMVTIPGWDTNYRCTILEVFNNRLVAAGLTVSGADAPFLVKWSHPVAYGDTTTYWDPADLTKTAGENLIVSDGQGIVGLQPLRNILIVYLDQSVWRIDITGQTRPPLQFTQVLTDDGATGPFAFTDSNGAAIVFGRRDIYQFDGFNKRSLTDGRMTRWLYDNVRLNYDPRLAFYPKRNQIFIFFRTRDAGYASNVLVLNEVGREHAWSIIDGTDAPEDGVLLTGFLGPNLDAATTTWQDLKDALTTWQDLKDAGTRWSDFYTVSEDAQFYYLSPTRKEIINSDAASGTNYWNRARLEHECMDFDMGGDSVGDRIKFISRLFPQITGSGTMVFRFGTRETPGGPVTWYNAIDYVIGTDIAVDLRVAGRYLAYEFYPKDATTRFRINGHDLKIRQAGRR